MDKAKNAFDFALKLTGSDAASTASCLYVVSAIRRASCSVTATAVPSHGYYAVGVVDLVMSELASVVLGESPRRDRGVDRLFRPLAPNGSKRLVDLV